MAFKDKYWKTNVETFFSYQGKKYMGQWPTFREMMEISEERFPDNEAFKAIVPKVVTFTYKEALKKIREIAYYLVATGAKKGDHIAVTGKNSPEWALAYFAISFAGCIIVPLDYSLHIEDMEKIANGLELEDGEIHADAISYANESDKKQVGIEIHSGRNRIVRRIFESLGYHVTKLDRVYFAGLTKKNLGRGKWRYLNEKEVNALRMGAFE